MVDGTPCSNRSSALVQPLGDATVVSGNTRSATRSFGRGAHQYVTVQSRSAHAVRTQPTHPGAIGAFRRDALEEVGGVPGDTLAEDTDLTLAIGLTGRRVLYADDARAWTEAPSSLGDLWRQRYRWSYGTMQAVWKHKGALLTRNPRARRIGRLALPYMILFQILLPIVAPLIDLFALYGLLFSNTVPVLAFWFGFNALQLTLATFAFRMDKESLKPLWALPLQQFVYRQLMYIVIIESTVSAVVGARAQWRHLTRTGDVSLETSRS